MTQEEVLEQVQFQGEMRGLAYATWHNYWLYIRQYQNHYGKAADELDINDVQQYLHHLRCDRKLKKGSVGLVNSALGFLYRRVLERLLDGEKIPRHGKSHKLPDILSREETLGLLAVWRGIPAHTQAIHSTAESHVGH